MFLLIVVMAYSVVACFIKEGRGRLTLSFNKTDDLLSLLPTFIVQLGLVYGNC